LQSLLRAKKLKKMANIVSPKYIKRYYRRLIHWYIKREWTSYKVNFRKLTYKKACAFLNKHCLWFDFWLNYKKRK